MDGKGFLTSSRTCMHACMRGLVRQKVGGSALLSYRGRQFSLFKAPKTVDLVMKEITKLSHEFLQKKAGFWLFCAFQLSSGKLKVLESGSVT